MYYKLYTRVNKTGLQPVSRPVQQIIGFFQKGYNAKNRRTDFEISVIRPMFHR